jgi:hypothetical protein
MNNYLIVHSLRSLQFGDFVNVSTKFDSKVIKNKIIDTNLNSSEVNEKIL